MPQKKLQYAHSLFSGDGSGTINYRYYNLLDIAIQHTGAVENAFDLALQNNRSIIDDLEAGESIELTAYGIQQNKDILSYYQAKKLQPATAISDDYSTDNGLQGIDYWAIQMDFVVS